MRHRCKSIEGSDPSFSANFILRISHAVFDYRQGRNGGEVLSTAKDDRQAVQSETRNPQQSIGFKFKQAAGQKRSPDYAAPTLRPS